MVLPEYRFVDNQPSDQVDLLGLVNSKEKWCLLCVAKVDAFWVWYISEMAKAVAATKYPPVPPSTVEPPEANAYRHCIWACTLTKVVGPEKAKAVEECHEKYAPGPPEDNAKDAANNAIGNEFGKNPASCATQCDAAMPPNGPPTLQL